MVIDLKTADGQLDMLCRVIGVVTLPRQQLNRVLQCRMAWRPVKGLPPTYRRALEKLASYLPQDTEPDVQVKKRGPGRPKKVKTGEDNGKA